MDDLSAEAALPVFRQPRPEIIAAQAMAKAIVDRDWWRVVVMPSLTTRRQDGGQINPEPAMPDRSSALYLAVAVSRRGDSASSGAQSGAFSR